ncbi:hypothetical protein A1O3_03400 [Capronia epimyces CBS 606.96]|uniref:Mitochondrial pyruvate carrier n=1 Tax=Capronia epimyces CBS 606.96 TaxID=1182542 RepID=W9YVZ4_9EURO|nr:uncharacterized protein A1O3_03400 [Capronia epimyces CBS 606.96]EXJ86449.1 hypothetical protein A1O3_03400 [Capronia epimyces CBS 606.96]
MSARFGLRFAQQSPRQFVSRTPFQARNPIFRRYQGTAANPAVESPVQQQSVWQRLWTSEVGIKTVHFWAPVMKWGVVLAGATDFLRPAEKLSLTQNLALVATGSIWTRWCFVIKPRNVLLAAVNFCLALVGSIQCARIFLYKRSVTGSTTEALKELEHDIEGKAKSTEKKIEQKI